MCPGIESLLANIFYFPTIFMAFPFRQAGIKFTPNLARIIICVSINFLILLQVGKLSIFGFAYEETGMISFCYRVQLVALCLTPLINIAWFGWNLPTLNVLAMNLDHTDIRLRAMGLVAQHVVSNTLLKATSLLCVPTFSLDLIMSLIKWYWSVDEVFTFIGIVLQSVMILFEIQQLLSLIQSRFNILLESIKCARINSRLNQHGIATIVSLYNCLCKICELTNSLYGPQIIALLTAAFTGLVVNIYYIVDDAGSVNFQFQTAVSIFDSILWVAINSTLTWVIVSSHVDVAEQAKEFNNLLYQIVINDKMNELSYNEKLQLHIAMKREVVFTACGFFNLDFTLIHSMIAAATTYLVILVQFGPLPPIIYSTPTTPTNSSASTDFNEGTIEQYN